MARQVKRSRCYWTKRGTDSWYGYCGTRYRHRNTHLTREGKRFVCAHWYKSNVRLRTVAGPAGSAKKRCERLAKRGLGRR